MMSHLPLLYIRGSRPSFLYRHGARPYKSPIPILGHLPPSGLCVLLPFRILSPVFCSGISWYHPSPQYDGRTSSVRPRWVAGRRSIPFLFFQNLFYSVDLCIESNFFDWCSENAPATVYNGSPAPSSVCIHCLSQCPTCAFHPSYSPAFWLSF